MTETRWHHFDSTTSLQNTLADLLCAVANDCIAVGHPFRIALAGGTTPRAIYEKLRGCATDWTQWQIYFGDERCLPVGDPSRNDSMAHSAWLNHVAIPTENIHAIAAQLPTDECLAHYTHVLHDVGAFDLVLLGLGEDGHTASLFPEQDWGCEDDAPAVLAIADAPKPPAARISLSVQRLSHAHLVWFIVTGSSKHAAIARWQADENIPAAAIAPVSGVDVFTAD
jgi:6-phosphogluconolactonase